MLREGQQKGRPTSLNRAIDFDNDTVFGMLWSARNGKTSGSSTIDAARYALGEGRQYEPDEFVRAMRDPKSYVYNPYALGSTVDETAEYFGVDGFNQKWLNDNQGILKSGNNTAIRHYQQVYDAEQLTLAAEGETRKLSDRIDARLNRAVSAGGAIDANVLLKDALFGLDTLQRMDEGLVGGDLAKLTRPVNYRWKDVANHVSGQVQIINARQNAPHNPAYLGLVARNEEEKVIQGQGTLIQKDAVPKSYTSFHESMPGLWAAGLTKNPLSAGWYAPAAGVQSGFGPDHEKAQAIADARRAGDFAAAAAQGYDALAGTGGDISKLSTNEGAVRMVIDLVLDTTKAFIPQQIAIPPVQGAVNRYDAAVNSILGIDPDAVSQILPQILYTTTVQGDIKNQASGMAGLLSSILRLGENALKTVTDHVLGEAPTLQTVQTMFHILKLLDMETGTKSEALQAAEAALLKAASDNLQSAAAQTGHEEMDDLTTIANLSSHNLDAVMKRWGMQGVNYIGNLLKAGRGDLAAAIVAMPTYAKSAIVAETNMRTFGLNDDAIAAQESALAADMKSPIVVLSAKQIAKQQAVEARKAELNAGGAFWIQSVLLQKVNEAGKTVNQSKSVLDQAVLNEQAEGDALGKAQVLFHKNMADSAAADAVVAAIGNLQKAIDARVKAQKEHKQNQQTLNNVQQKLTNTQKQATARVDEQAKQDVDAKRLKLAEIRAKLMVQAGGQAGEQGNVMPGRTQLWDIQDAAPNGSLYINNKSLQAINDLRNGNDQLPLESVDLASDQFSHLANKNGSGIIKEDEPQLESDAAIVSQDKGSRPFRALAASGTVTDVGFANENQDVKESDEEDTVKEPGIDDLLNAVMTPEQLEYLADVNNEALGFFTNEQRQRALAGENFGEIFDELDLGKQDQMNQLSQKVLAELATRQKSDLLFLGSGPFAGIDLKTRQAILQHLNENGGKITYDDLVDLGVYEPGTLAEGGFKRWLQDLDMGGGPAHFADLLAEEYTLSDFETSFAKLDQEQRNQRGAEMTMLFAMIAAPIIDRALYGPSNQIFGNNRFDNLERQGTTGNFTGSKGYTSPTVEENPGRSMMVTENPVGQMAGTENPSGQSSNGVGKIIGTTSGLTQAEKKVVDYYIEQGKNVEIISKDPSATEKTPDFMIDEVTVELKTISNSNVNSVVTKIQNGFQQSAAKVLIDASNSGLSAQQAQEAINRAVGTYKNGVPGIIEIWYNGGSITYP